MCGMDGDGGTAGIRGGIAVAEFQPGLYAGLEPALSLNAGLQPELNIPAAGRLCRELAEQEWAELECGMDSWSQDSARVRRARPVVLRRTSPLQLRRQPQQLRLRRTAVAVGK
jgi:hypothetical protein